MVHYNVVHAAHLIVSRTSVYLQAVSNSLWAYAKLGYNPGSRLLDVTAHRAIGMLHQYTSQEIANTLWAMATLEHHPSAMLLDAAAVQIARRVEQFSPQVGYVGQPEVRAQQGLSGLLQLGKCPGALFH